MASASTVLRTCGLLLYLTFQVHASVNKSTNFDIQSLTVGSEFCENNSCKYLVNISGGEFLGHQPWRLTSGEGAKGSSCKDIIPNFEIKEIETTQWFSRIEVTLPKIDGKVYFCLRQRKEGYPFDGEWMHQGVEYFLEPKIDVASSENENSTATAKIQQETQLVQESNTHIQETNTNWVDLTHDIDVNYLPNITRSPREDVEIFNVLEDKDKSIKHYVTKDRNNEENQENNNVQNNGPINQNNYVNDGKFNNQIIVGNENVFENKFNTKENNNNVPEIYILNNKLNTEANNYENKNIKEPQNNININNNDSNINFHFKDITPNFAQEFKHVVDELNLISKGLNLEVSNSVNSDNLSNVRRTRQIDDFPTRVISTQRPIIVEGVRIEYSAKEPKIEDDGVPSVLAESYVTLRLYGEGITPKTVIAFTYDPKPFGEQCKFLLKGEYMVKEGTLQPKTALFDVKVPLPNPETHHLYICTKNLQPNIDNPTQDEEKYYHQGTEPWKIIATHQKLLPLWVSICLILFCLMFSALFSGLNLGLMSLDRTELKIISNTGTEQERKYARAIMPVRDHGNYLLCSILLGNVAVNSTFTILLDELTSGLFAVIFSTLAIVLLGEITPQAICSRHGLMVGAKSIMVTKGVMAVTAPLSFPVSKLLDYFLGEEIGNVYNRERLKELVKVTTDVNDLDNDEVNIISGALEMRKIMVKDVMTKLEDAFMLPITSVLDFETMSEIVKSGYSRIPVYEGTRGDIVTVLFIKDLAFVDPDDNTPLRTLCQYYQNPCNFVFEDVTLDVMLKQFKDGHKGHMAFVHRINNEGEGDPFYETIGLVTLEDVIEEMIQAEIVDETDVFLDNRTKKRRRPQNKLQDFAAFAERHENQRFHISPQLTLATFQFLSTTVEAFKPDTVSETVLQRLLKQDVIHYIKIKGKTKKDPTTYIFQQGKPVDYFVLILEGRVEVTVGRENLVFEAGPFTYFGVQALTPSLAVAESPTLSVRGSQQNISAERHTFVPDYCVRAVSTLYYLTVKRSLYLAAKRATLMEKGNISKGTTSEQFDTEVDKKQSHSIDMPSVSKNYNNSSEEAVSSTSGVKLLQSVDEDLSITGEHKTPSRQVSPHTMPVSPAPRNNLTTYSTADEQQRLLQ